MKYNVPDDAPAKDVLNTAIRYVRDNYHESKEEIIKMFMELELETSESLEDTTEERTTCARYLAELIRNMSNQLNNKSKNNSYPGHIINVCMSLYLTSKPGYNTHRESGLLSLPHPSTISEIKQDLKIRLGGDPSIYRSFLKEVKPCKHDVIGYLMVDEIKLKNGITFNVQNNEITGFVKE